MRGGHLARLTYFLTILVLLFGASPSYSQDSSQATTAVSSEVHDQAESDEAESQAGIAAEEEPEPSLFDILTIPKHLVMLGLAAVGLILLFVRKVNFWVRLVGLIVIFILFGSDQVYLLHPSPMCAVTKLFMFKFTWGEWFIGFLAFFLVIFVPSLIYRKAFCGWVCPLGAFQELINKIPSKWRIKQFNFTAFNSIRMTLLAAFLLTFFAVKSYMDALGAELGHLELPIWKAYSAYNIYDPINYFEYLHWTVDAMWIFMMGILVIASFLLYRPFCYLICPIGAISWLLEKVAPGKIRIDRNKCNECGVCIIKSPCPTIQPLIKADSFGLPDCTSCGECLITCNRDAIKFSFKN